MKVTFYSSFLLCFLGLASARVLPTAQERKEIPNNYESSDEVPSEAGVGVKLPSWILDLLTVEHPLRNKTVLGQPQAISADNDVLDFETFAKNLVEDGSKSVKLVEKRYINWQTLMNNGDTIADNKIYHDPGSPKDVERRQVAKRRVTAAPQFDEEYAEQNSEESTVDYFYGYNDSDESFENEGELQQDENAEIGQSAVNHGQQFAQYGQVSEDQREQFAKNHREDFAENGQSIDGFFQNNGFDHAAFKPAVYQKLPVPEAHNQEQTAQEEIMPEAAAPSEPAQEIVNFLETAQEEIKPEFVAPVEPAQEFAAPAEVAQETFNIQEPANEEIQPSPVQPAQHEITNEELAVPAIPVQELAFGEQFVNPDEIIEAYAPAVLEFNPELGAPMEIIQLTMIEEIQNLEGADPAAQEEAAAPAEVAFNPEAAPAELIQEAPKEEIQNVEADAPAVAAQEEPHAPAEAEFEAEEAAPVEIIQEALKEEIQNLEVAAPAEINPEEAAAPAEPSQEVENTEQDVNEEIVAEAAATAVESAQEEIKPEVVSPMEIFQEAVKQEIMNVEAAVQEAVKEEEAADGVKVEELTGEETAEVIAPETAPEETVVVESAGENKEAAAAPETAEATSEGEKNTEEEAGTTEETSTFWSSITSLEKTIGKFIISIQNLFRPSAAAANATVAPAAAGAQAEPEKPTEANKDEPKVPAVPAGEQQSQNTTTAAPMKK